MKQVMSSKPNIRLFAVCLIFLLVPLNCWWVVASTLRVGTCPTQISLYFNAIFTILVVMCISFLSQLRGKTPLLNRAEIIAIYTCVSIGSGIAGVDRMLVLIQLPGHASWFATPENDWADLFYRYVPKWLTISDKQILKGYYEGVSTFYDLSIIKAWLPVVLWWSAFIVATHLVMLCINVILRKRWVEYERLSYPIIQLPLEMTQPQGKFSAKS